MTDETLSERVKLAQQRQREALASLSQAAPAAVSVVGIGSDVVDERPVDDAAVDMRQVLPNAQRRELREGILTVLSERQARGEDVGQQATFVAVWIAPRLAALEFAVQDERLRVRQVGTALAKQAAEMNQLREQRDELARRLRRNEVRVSLEMDTPTIARWAVDVAREKATEELANWAAHVRDSFTSADELLEQMETRLGQLRGGAAPGDDDAYAESSSDGAS